VVGSVPGRFVGVAKWASLRDHARARRSSFDRMDGPHRRSDPLTPHVANLTCDVIATTTLGEKLPSVPILSFLAPAHHDTSAAWAQSRRSTRTDGPSRSRSLASIGARFGRPRHVKSCLRLQISYYLTKDCDLSLGCHGSVQSEIPCCTGVYALKFINISFQLCNSVFLLQQISSSRKNQLAK